MWCTILVSVLLSPLCSLMSSWLQTGEDIDSNQKLSWVIVNLGASTGKSLTMHLNLLLNHGQKADKELKWNNTYTEKVSAGGFGVLTVCVLLSFYWPSTSTKKQYDLLERSCFTRFSWDLKFFPTTNKCWVSSWTLLQEGRVWPWDWQFYTLNTSNRKRANCILPWSKHYLLSDMWLDQPYSWCLNVFTKFLLSFSVALLSVFLYTFLPLLP